MRGRNVKEQRRKKALALSKERGKRTSQQQLALLDERFGEGLGAKKERAKLATLINKETKQKSEPKTKRKPKTKR